MCAIIGWAGKIKNATLRALIKNAEPRGPHSTGLVFDESSHPLSRSSGLNVFKRAVTPTFFLSRHYRRVRRAAAFQLGFAHVRWATHGDVVDRNAHPFFHASEDGSTLVYCHNGVINNYLDFAPDAVVDSECFGPLLEEKTPARAHGSTGLCWFQTSTDGTSKMFVYRRDQQLKAFTFSENGEVFTIIASTRTIIPSELFLLPHFETNLAEGVAYRVKPGGLARAWDDLHIQRTYNHAMHVRPRRHTHYTPMQVPAVGAPGAVVDSDAVDSDTDGAEPCSAGDCAQGNPHEYAGG